MANDLDKKLLFRVKTCATSANMGPGYDIAALALDIFNECEVFKGNGANHSIEYAGPYAGEIDQKSDLVIPAIKTVTEEYAGRIIIQGKNVRRDASNKSIENGTENGEEDKLGLHAGIFDKEDEGLPYSLDIKMTVNIPPGKGLGSSASAVTAGVLIANKAYNMDLNKKELFHAAAKMESSPDNAAAALSGGMAIVYLNGEEQLFEKIELSRDYKILLFVPLGIAETKEARKIIPKKVPLEDVVYNISNFSLLVKSLKEGDIRGAAVFFRDYLYQKYRKAMYPLSMELVRVFIETYGIPAFISGSGPAVITIMDEEMFSRFKDIRSKLGAYYLSFHVMVTNISEDGSQYF